MNISLAPDLDQFVRDKITIGPYQDANEVIGEGLRLLRDRDQNLESLRSDVRAGFEAVERGEFSTFDAGNIKELADRVKARGRERLPEVEGR